MSNCSQNNDSDIVSMRVGDDAGTGGLLTDPCAVKLAKHPDRLGSGLAYSTQHAVQWHTLIFCSEQYSLDCAVAALAELAVVVITLEGVNLFYKEGSENRVIVPVRFRSGSPAMRKLIFSGGVDTAPGTPRCLLT